MLDCHGKFQIWSSKAKVIRGESDIEGIALNQNHQKKILSISTICCNLAIVTHGEKMYN